jgi:hypothetical protein
MSVPQDIVPLKVLPEPSQLQTAPSTVHLKANQVQLDFPIDCPMPLALMLVTEVLSHV